MHGRAHSVALHFEASISHNRRYDLASDSQFQDMVSGNRCKSARCADADYLGGVEGGEVEGSGSLCRLGAGSKRASSGKRSLETVNNWSESVDLECVVNISSLIK